MGRKRMCHGFLRRGFEAHMANKAVFRSMAGSQQDLWADGELVVLNAT